eukprot:bmy_18825T0
MVTLTAIVTVPYEVRNAFLFFSVLEFAVGILVNAFIFLMNFWVVVRRWPLSNCDLVLLNLSLTWLFLHGLLFLDAIQLTHFQWIKDPLSLCYQTILMLWMLVNQAGLWLTTCLSLLYCSKTVHFFHTFLLRLASWISRKIPQMLLGAIFSSCVCIVLYFLGSIPSFLLFLVSSGVLIVSLGRHMRTRRAKTRDSRDPSLEAHIKALRSRLFLLPVCGVLLHCLHLGAFADAVAQQDRGHGLCRDTGSLPLGAHSHPDLRQCQAEESCGDHSSPGSEQPKEWEKKRGRYLLRGRPGRQSLRVSPGSTPLAHEDGALPGAKHRSV